LIQQTLHLTYKAAKRIVIAIVGATVVLLGIVMIVTPGPALVVIPVGLAILSIEFAWARHWLRKMRETISNGLSNNRARRAEAYRNHITEPEKRKAPER
jgi:tellurite resistance protein TerC